MCGYERKMNYNTSTPMTQGIRIAAQQLKWAQKKQDYQQENHCTNKLREILTRWCKNLLKVYGISTKNQKQTNNGQVEACNKFSKKKT